MTFLPVRPPYLIRRYYSDFIWRMPDDDRKVYLTFDDGPIPEVTEFVLDVLKSEDVAATFFCIGDNVEKHPEIFRRILSEGHSVGNHTYNHLNGWNTPVKPYIDNVLKAGAVIDTTLFRPPYGRIRKEQADAVSIRYKIVMWDVLSYDFDANITPQRSLKNVVENTRPGSVIVFHDSLKARRNMEFAFPAALKELKKEGFGFGSLK